LADPDALAASLGNVGGVEQAEDEPLAAGLRSRPSISGGGRSVVVSSPADGTPHGAKQNEDQSDDQEDDPNHPQNGDLGDESDNQQDEAQSDHLFS
jgi:hypothetical protein